MANKKKKAPESKKKRELAARELSAKDLLASNRMTDQQLTRLMLHPVASALMQRIFVNQKGQLLADIQAIEKMEDTLVAMANSGSGQFFEAFRQVLNLALTLSEEHPEERMPKRLLEVLDEVAGVALPIMGKIDAEASQQLIHEMGHKFQKFTEAGEGKQLPDSGERVDIKPIVNRNIKG